MIQFSGKEMSMARFDLTDLEWSVIEPLLPTKVRGVKRYVASIMTVFGSASAEPAPPSSA